jgi:Ecdysteroid kinase-like family
VLGSPVIDLLYFLSTSLAPEVLRECRDELVYTYYDVLTLILKSLNYEGFVPTLTDLHLELLKKGGLEVIYSLTTAPYLRSDTGDIVPAIQPELCQPQNVANLKTMANKILTDQKDELNERLRYFDNYGLLDWGAGESKIKGLMNRLFSVNQQQAEQLTMRRGAIGQN